MTQGRSSTRAAGSGVYGLTVRTQSVCLQRAVALQSLCRHRECSCLCDVCTHVYTQAAHWWVSGKHYVQCHADGTSTVRWRVRMLDYDMQTGTINARLVCARFRLITKML